MKEKAVFRNPKIVCVEWEDTTSRSGYLDLKDPETYGITLTKTFGHLAKKNKHIVVVVSEVFEDGDMRHSHSIPRKMVKSIRELK